MSADPARAFAARWRTAGQALDAERLARLRALSERDAARLFATLLAHGAPIRLRECSGLVEQQRLLARLRESQG
jgi:hypothetical protein